MEREGSFPDRISGASEAGAPPRQLCAQRARTPPNHVASPPRKTSSGPAQLDGTDCCGLPISNPLPSGDGTVGWFNELLAHPPCAHCAKPLLERAISFVDSSTGRSRHSLGAPHPAGNRDGCCATCGTFFCSGKPARIAVGGAVDRRPPVISTKCDKYGMRHACGALALTRRKNRLPTAPPRRSVAPPAPPGCGAPPWPRRL